MTAASPTTGRPAPLGAERTQRARRLLARHFGPSQLLVDERDGERYRNDASEARGELPLAVVLAEKALDVELALSVAAEAGVPIVPRGGGTGKTGGAVPIEGGIVLDTLRFAQIKEINRREGLAVVEPGVILSAFHAAVASEGLFYAPDPNSRVGCSIGGNVATNAGGPRAFKYGVTGRYVLGVEAFLVGGQRIQTGHRTAKGVTGYDLTSLLVGSEGTLAVFGDITLRLLRPPEVRETLLVAFERMAHAAGAVMAVVAAGLQPSCLELLDLRLLGDGVRREVGAGSGNAEALLLIEVDGDAAACRETADRVAGVCQAHGARDVQLARDPETRDRMWAVRSNMSATLRKSARQKLSEDIAVPREALAELLARLEQTSQRLAVRSVAYGHAGDGNLHVNFLWDEPDEAPRVQLAIRELFEHTVALGGTLSGEHGIGVLKAPYLSLEQSPALIGLERNLKQTFDPQGLLNPGKIFPRPLAPRGAPPSSVPPSPVPPSSVPPSSAR
ncbi:MAG TPA: FAD-linked oxidase C-terminal domain-containing protein [Polyangiaceae bacterium]|nr:FAD-linked oxidase C-terminal domain-containing protein [Polyangiaceae bacterium]